MSDSPVEYVQEYLRSSPRLRQSFLAALWEHRDIRGYVFVYSEFLTLPERIHEDRQKYDLESISSAIYTVAIAIAHQNHR